MRTLAAAYLLLTASLLPVFSGSNELFIFPVVNFAWNW